MKLPWPGFNEKGSLIIPLEWSEVPFPQRPINVEGERFEPKDELHVTVIGKKPGHVILEKILPDPRIESTLRQNFEEIDWSLNLGDMVHLLSRETVNSAESALDLEETIVLPLQVSGMAAFYECLKSHGLLPGNTLTPPPHITLYTRNCPGGIGVPDEATLIRLTRRTIPVIDLLFQDQHSR